jgi:PIN domain
LQSVYTDAYNLRGGGGAVQNGYERLLAYVEWTSEAVRMLGNQIGNGDLDRLVLTERYRLLLAGLVGTMTSTERSVQRVVNGLVSLELDERVADFEAAIKSLQGQIARWSAYGHYAVPDTSFYIHHKDKLTEVDFGPLIDVWQSEVTVLVPIVIVDELDRLKASKDKDKRVRWRAGYTLAVLDRLFADRPVSGD